PVQVILGRYIELQLDALGIRVDNAGPKGLVHRQKLGGATAAHTTEQAAEAAASRGVGCGQSGIAGQQQGNQQKAYQRHGHIRIGLAGIVKPVAANASDKLPPGLSDALDAIRMNDDASLAIQTADGLLEVALADPEQASDFRSGAFVAQVQHAVILIQRLHDQGLQTVAGIAADRLQAQTDLAVGTHLTDVAPLALAAAYELEDFILVNQPPMTVIDDRLVPQIRGFHDQQAHGLADLIVGWGLVQITVQARCGSNAFAVLVEVDMHHAIIADLQWALFFRVRQQQVFRQPPVEEQPHSGDLNHLQTGKLTDLDLGVLC